MEIPDCYHTRSNAGYQLDKIYADNKSRFGPAGVRATDIPKLIKALDTAVNFIEECDQWNLETLKSKCGIVLDEINGFLEEEGTP